MEFLSKEFVAEIAQQYFGGQDYSIQAYSEKFVSSVNNQTNRFTVGTANNTTFANPFFTYGTIIVLPAGTTPAGNLDLRNCGNVLRQFQLIYNTTNTVFPWARFRVVPPGHGTTGTMREYYVIPNNAICDNVTGIESTRQGWYTWQAFSTVNYCAFVDPCLYVGYLMTNATTLQDIVINTFDWQYSMELPDISHGRGYVMKSNYMSLSETTADNIQVFNSMFLRCGTGAAFTGFRITPNQSNRGNAVYTILPLP